MPRVYLSDDDLRRIRAHKVGKSVLRANSLLREVQSIMRELLESTTIDGMILNSEYSPENRAFAKNDVDVLTHVTRILQAQTVMAQALPESISAVKGCCRLALRHCRLSLSPWKLLPDEVWSDIFVASLRSSPIQLPPERRRDAMSKYLTPDCIPVETPWAFLEVCSRWRRIALDESRLWDNFVFKWNENRFQDAGFIWQVHNVLKRNKRLSTSLLYGSGLGPLTTLVPHSPTIGNSIPFIREIVIPFSNTLTSLNVSIFSSAIMAEIDRLVPKPFLPVLEEIAIKISDDNDGLPTVDIPLPLIDKFLASSHLRRIELNCAFTDHVLSSGNSSLPPLFPLDLHVAWHGLTSLILRGMYTTPETAYEIVSNRCPLLEEFGVSVWPPDFLDDHPQKVTLPCMKKLSLVDGFFSFIQYIKADNLQELSLQCLTKRDHIPSGMEGEDIITDFVRGSPKISTLSLELTLATIDISLIIEHCRNLTELYATEMDLPVSTMWIFTKNGRWPRELQCRIPLHALDEFTLAIKCYYDGLNKKGVEYMPFKAFIRVITETADEENVAYKATHWMNNAYKARLWDIDVMWVRTEVLENDS